MNISADTLFHFTKSMDNLIGILTNNFQPRLCLEDNTVYEEPYDRMAIPMVCFCDIPLGNITGHMKNYGHYAIGLKKSWAQKKGLNPVMYVNDKSTWMGTQRGLFYDMMDEIDDSSQIDKLIYQQAFVKLYEGRQVVNGKNKKLRFYDEREWRYVPPMFESNRPNFLSADQFEDEREKQALNERLARGYSLPYTPKDINYIIVGKDSELLDAKRRIECIKRQFYSLNDVELLCTKLISAERIRKDF